MAQTKSSDTHFFSTFSAVLGILILLAIVLFAAARLIGRHTQGKDVRQDPLYAKEVRENIAPFAH